MGPPTTKIRAIDQRLIDDLFEMGGGYVLDFSNRTFAEFFADEIGVDIDSPRYEAEGTSKAKRLRLFLRTCDDSVRLRTLSALWEYRQAHQRRNRLEERIPNAQQEFEALIERLGGKSATSKRGGTAVEATKLDPIVLSQLGTRLLALSKMDPQSRGFGYERFLKDVFDVNGLAARSSFRLVGEQIDGSFELSGETYLLEAKWQALPVGASDLRAFNGKVEEKAAWSRGLFVSESGFSEDGLVAFGRGKRVVCMDGLDIYEMLQKGFLFVDVMSRKVRHAAETGSPFVRVRDLFV
jgi:predicted protein tyrosine phosphatase